MIRTSNPALLNILHITNRLSTRRGADIHLLGIIKYNCVHHQVVLAVGLIDGTTAPPPARWRQTRRREGCDGALERRRNTGYHRVDGRRRPASKALC